MSLTLRQLEVFLVAAEDCNFRRAAQRLGVSQPSVSGRIRSLESYLGYELFDRSTGSRPRLTLEGRAFVARARHLVSGASELSARRKTAAGRAPLRLTIVIGPLLLKHRVMPALSTFCYENPGLAPDFVPLGGTTDGNELFRTGRADVLLYSGDPPEEPGLEAEVFSSSPCSIFGAPSLVERVGDRADAVAAAPFILPPDHHTWARWVRARLALAGITPTKVVGRPPFPELIVRMMQEGRGLSVFFDEFARGHGLEKIALPLKPASRVLLVGPRALQAAAAPLLRFLRRTVTVNGIPECP